MALGLAILIIVGVYQVSTRANNKRLAKKHGYSGLDHDGLWRPLDKKNGKRLTKNEAKALAQYRKEGLGQTEYNAVQVNDYHSEGSSIEEEDGLPNYTQVRQEIRKEKRQQNNFDQMRKKDGGILAIDRSLNNPTHLPSIPNYEQSGAAINTSRAII